MPQISREGKVLRHTVNLKYKENATAHQVDEAVKTFFNLKNGIPEIADIEWGLNDSSKGNSKGLTHCFTMTFTEEHARKIYLFHKAHLDLIGKIAPIIADLPVLDYWTEQ